MRNVSNSPRQTESANGRLYQHQRSSSLKIRPLSAGCGTLGLVYGELYLSTVKYRLKPKSTCLDIWSVEKVAISL
jgi:hypothetical protein